MTIKFLKDISLATELIECSDDDIDLTIDPGPPRDVFSLTTSEFVKDDELEIENILPKNDTLCKIMVSDSKVLHRVPKNSFIQLI